MKTLFIASGPYSWGSARMRCYWPAKYMTDAHVILNGEPLPTNFDNYIFQKQAANEDVMRKLGEMGKRVYWDLCDPMWWWSPEFVEAIAPLCHRLVFSSRALEDDYLNWCSSETLITIPDRLDFDHFKQRAVLADRSPIRLIWYGVAVNRIALMAALANLERLAANGVKFELTIFDDRPEVQWLETDSFPVYHVRWSVEKEIDILTAHDIALLPPYPGPWGRVKSPNKKITAWACGLPVTTGEDYNELYDICHMLEMRVALANAGWREAETNWRAEQSAKDWEVLLAE